MPPSKNISMYNDVRQILDAIGNREKASLLLDTPGQAVNFRQRVYTFKRLALEEVAARNAHLPGYIPSTPYDDITMDLAKGSNKLFFFRRQAPSRLMDEEGNPIEIEPLAVEDEFITEDPDDILENLETILGDTK